MAPSMYQYTPNNQYYYPGQPQQMSWSLQKSMPYNGVPHLPLSRQSQTNSHAMTVKEHDERKRSLSLCSISEHTSGYHDKQGKERRGADADVDCKPLENLNVVITPMN